MCLHRSGLLAKTSPQVVQAKCGHIVGVLAMLNQTYNSIKMSRAFITTINVLLVIPGMVNQHTFTQKFSTTPRARKLSTLHLCKFDPAMVHFMVLV